MIDRCFNPACKRKLQYLRDGRVVRVLRGKNETVSVEHYWLCGPCYHTHDFKFSADGSVRLKSKPGDESGDELLIGDVLFPERRSARAPGASRKPNLTEGLPNDPGLPLSIWKSPES